MPAFLRLARTKSSRRSFLLLTLISVTIIVAFATACSSQDDNNSTSRDTMSARGNDGPPEDITVGLLLDDQGKLTVLGTAAPRLVDEAPRRFTAGDALIFWELTNAKGKIVANGAMIDPRRASSEVDDNGSANAAFDVVDTTAMFDITIPNVDGTIHLYDNPRTAQSSNKTGGVRVQSLQGGDEIASAPVTAAADGEPTASPELAPATSTGDLGGGLKRIVDNSKCGDDFAVLIVPEGYTDMEAFARDAASVASSLQGIPGFTEHKDQTSVYTQDFVSAEDGISDPDNKITKKTAFNASFGRGELRRCILPHSGIPATTAAKLFIAKEKSGAEVVAMIANTTEYGGCAQPANKLLAITRHASAPSTIAHELGHAMFGLSDEYAGGGSTCNPRGADTPNTGNNVKALPWRDILTTDELPTTSGGDNATVGAFEGARYCATGVFRPSPDCKMRTATVDFCPVCKRRVDQTFSTRRTARRKPSCDADAGPDASTARDAAPDVRVRPDSGPIKIDAGPKPDAGQQSEQPRLYDSCTGRKDGVYCSELVDFSAIVCEGESIKEGQQCGGGKCTGPNGPGKEIKCSGSASDAPNVDSCAGRANGVYCSQVASNSNYAFTCLDGSISGGIACPNDGEKCTGPNGAGTEIRCQ